MAKAALPGRVKTRLCPPCTPAQAAAIATAALEDTLAAVLACGHPVLVALDGEPGPWLPEGVPFVAQRGGTFNQRLAHAWTHLTGGGVQIGMDTPQVTAELLERALVDVAREGAALGPASDGGWWLLGLREPDPAAFRRVPMSRPDTGRRQLAQLRRLRLEPALQPILTDIDTWDDAAGLASSIPGSATAAAVDLVRRSLRTRSLVTIA